MAIQKDRYQLIVDTKNAQAGLFRLSNLMKGFAGVIAIREIVQFGGAIVDATKTMQTLENQLRLVTTNAGELDRLLLVLRKTALDNRTAFASTVELFVKLRVATEELGISEERIITVTGKLSQALQVAGADAATTNSVIRQFGQAMASGTVRGDEFNSLVEGLGPALAIMARESGITVGELRRMSQAGELTAEKMFKMIEASNSLTKAFNQMKPTLENLEQRFSDTFDAFLIKLGEATGVTQGYENALQRITRLMEDFADVQGSLTDLAPDDIFKRATEGAISYDAALYELAERIRNENWFGWLPGVGMTDAQIEAINEYIRKLQELKIEASLAAREEEAAAEIADEHAQALARVLAPHKRFIDQAKEFAKTDYRTELEKANQRVIDAEIVIEQLNLAFERSNGQIDNFVMLLRGAEKELEAAKTKLNELKEAANKPTGFEKFYQELVQDGQEIVDTLEYIERAQIKLFKAHMEGTISTETFANANKILSERLKAIKGDYDALAVSTSDFINSMRDGFSDLQQEAKTINMDPLERQLSDIAYGLTQDANRAMEDLTKQAVALGGDPAAIAKINEQKQRIREAVAEEIKQRQELATQVYHQQRSFEYGWKKAFESYQDEATNAAKKAEEVFTKATRGMEDAIVDFAKTGKFEWKTLIADMLETLLRSQIQQAMMTIFKIPMSGGGTVGGGLGNIFGGFFANGGFLPANKIGIVGEQGPEVISGPANITPLTNGLGNTNVTYNINAVDALSFRQLVARDPGFIHAVAMKGGSAVPSGR